MKQYDVIIVGAATTGSYFAHEMARQGHSVLALDAKSPEQMGTKYDIYHVARKDFDRFGLPLPERGRTGPLSSRNWRTAPPLTNTPKRAGTISSGCICTLIPFG